MSTYAIHSLTLRKEVSETARQSLALINKLDKKIRILSRRLDTKLNIGTDDRNPEDAEEISLLKKAIEAISLRKVQLATKCFEVLDQNVKIVESEMTTLENKIKTTLPVETAEQKNERKRKLFADVQEESDEVLYCTCQVSTVDDGMIACDNEECPTQMFHIKCVGLLKKPRNSWLCPQCSARRRYAKRRALILFGV